jgi:DNA-binding PadR family transcriptional regulator
MPPERSLSNGPSQNPPSVLPSVTHLQFLVLDIVKAHAKGLSANDLREALLREGQAYSGPRFYQLLARLEASGWIDSWSQHFAVGGGTVERTYYRITSKGKSAWDVTLIFYRTRILLAEKLGWTP